MTTYYPLRAAAKYAGVTKRTIYRWMSEGIRVDGASIRLKSIRIDGRDCIEEHQLNTFLSTRLLSLDAQKQQHEKFSID